MAFASTHESTNFVRLCNLLVDVGCTALRDAFDSIQPPADLLVVLSNPPVFTTLKSLRKKRVLNPFQWKKLFPTVSSSVSSANFDAPLLVVLLTNICGLSPPVSTGNWDKLPPDSDNSTEANLVRFKCHRNEVYAHASEASVDDPTFNELWQKISSTILALQPGTNYSLYVSAINQLKTESLDHGQKLLMDWKNKGDDILSVTEIKFSYLKFFHNFFVFTTRKGLKTACTGTPH